MQVYQTRKQLRQKAAHKMYILEKDGVIRITDDPKKRDALIQKHGFLLKEQPQKISKKKKSE